VAKIPLAQNLPRYLSAHRIKVFTKDQLVDTIRDYSLAINQPLDAQPEAYIDHLVGVHQLLRLELQGPKGKVERFAIKMPTQFEVGLSLKKESYFSHLSAAYLHGFIKKEPSVIYVSAEGQYKDPIGTDLEQESISESFEKQQRQSGAEFKWDEYRFLLLTARHTGLLGIEKRGKFLLTSPERTLIDLMVRPLYGGGAAVIAEIFKKTIDTINVERLLKIFDAIPFTYPYHQSLGWYLSRAGYRGKYLKVLRKRPMPFTFYLDYGMKKPLHSMDWNLYYPKELS
jgi:hypothetical protein